MNYTTETKKLRLALDTNILVYIEGVNGISRQRNATQTVAKLPRGDTFVPAQVLGELFCVLVGKAKFPHEKARATIINYLELFPIIDTSSAILKSAADLSVNHQLQIWDAVILAAAAGAGCRLLLSEDMQEGFTWNGVTIANPFAAKRHELLDELLEE